MAPMLWRLRSFPDFCEPCLPSQVERPATGRDWIHEIKHDGFRLLARRGAERVRLFTRKGHDWTGRFPLIVEALRALKAITCLIVARPSPAARPALQNSMDCVAAAVMYTPAPLISLSWTDAICALSRLWNGGGYWRNSSASRDPASR